jgi:hypothetical protein
VLGFFPLLCSLLREIAGIRFDMYKPALGLSERLGSMLTSVKWNCKFELPRHGEDAG